MTIKGPERDPEPSPYHTRDILAEKASQIDTLGSASSGTKKGPRAVLDLPPWITPSENTPSEEAEKPVRASSTATSRISNTFSGALVHIEELREQTPVGVGRERLEKASHFIEKLENTPPQDIPGKLKKLSPEQREAIREKLESLKPSELTGSSRWRLTSQRGVMSEELKQTAITDTEKIARKAKYADLRSRMAETTRPLRQGLTTGLQGTASFLVMVGGRFRELGQRIGIVISRAVSAAVAKVVPGAKSSTEELNEVRDKLKKIDEKWRGDPIVDLIRVEQSFTSFVFADLAEFYKALPKDQSQAAPQLDLKRKEIQLKLESLGKDDDIKNDIKKLHLESILKNLDVMKEMKADSWEHELSSNIQIWDDAANNAKKHIFAEGIIGKIDVRQIEKLLLKEQELVHKVAFAGFLEAYNSLAFEDENLKNIKGLSIEHLHEVGHPAEREFLHAKSIEDITAIIQKYL